MSTLDEEAIRSEAKRILDTFSLLLDTFTWESVPSTITETGFRNEGARVFFNSDFRSLMFANAPQTGKDVLLAEKKQW